MFIKYFLCQFDNKVEKCYYMKQLIEKGAFIMHVYIEKELSNHFLSLMEDK